MSERSKKLLRQFRKILGSEDVEATFTQLAGHLRDKDAASPEAIYALEHFSEFCSSIEESYAQYEEQSRMASRSLQISSDELTQSNRSLEQLNTSIETMLNSLGEGFLFFDEKGICSPIFSKACLEILEVNPANMHIRDVLRLTGKERETIDSWINMLFNNDLALSFSDLAAIAPSHYRHSKGMIVELTFKPMYRANKSLGSVLVIATDVTREESAKKELKMREARALRTLRIARNRNHFLRFIEHCDEIFTLMQLDCPIGSLEEFKRDIHTLKGLAGTFQLLDLAQTLHSIESEIANLMERGVNTLPKVIESIRRFLPDAYKHFSSAKMLAAEVLGDNFEQMGYIRTIETSRILSFLEQLKVSISEKKPSSEIERHFLENVMAVPVHSALYFLDMMLHELAERVGKRLHRCNFSGENFPILAEPYEDLFSSLVHAARNIVDHGIEEPGLREQLGKASGGLVTVTTEKFTHSGEEWFRLRIADDGGGIDLEGLRHSLARKHGESVLAGKSDQEVMQMIFEDGISTRDQTTEFSGRGVGMSAIRGETLRLGGKIWVESESLVGTTLIFELPLIWRLAPFVVKPA
ncbi:MAG: ATP-binding protein [Rickettsiales bacterium]